MIWNTFKIKGTTGVDCQTVIPPCASNPCSNNGTCVSNNNSYSCVCPPGLKLV